VWQDYRDGNNEIYYKNSSNGGTIWSSDIRLTNDPGNAFNSSISIYDSILHVLWTDNRDGNFEIYYKRDPTGNPVGIININSEIPKEYKLSQNYPNPFNPATKIRFSLPNPSEGGAINAQLVIFDILGREVATLVNEQLKPGTYEVDFDGTKLTSGIYFYVLKTDASTPLSTGFTATKKMLMVK